MSKKGIDVSSYQGVIDWEAVKADGIEFAIIRAGYGRETVDPYFSRNAEECIRLGIPFGAYWFIYGTNESESVQNAKKFHQTIAPYKDKITMKVWCDLEYDTDNYAKKCGVTLTKEMRTKMVIAFCEYMESYGYDVGNYANRDYLRSKFNDLSRYPLWYARYDVSEETMMSEYQPYMWQRSSKGTVKGIKGNVDMNVLYGEIGGSKMSTRDKVLSVCNQELGNGEPDGDDKYISWFNENILKTWSFTMDVAWCSIFATYAGVNGGLTGAEFPLTANCDEGMNWFKDKKQWKNGLAYGGNYTPKKGDMVYYSSTNNQNDSTHVGWVESCDGTLMVAVEGNYSNKVKKRTIYLSDPYILGYGIINYPDEMKEAQAESNPLRGTGTGTGIALELMNVREGASTAHKCVGTVLKNSSVEILAMTENNWLKIVWDMAKDGYAYVCNAKPYFNVTWKETSYQPKVDNYAVGTVVQFNGTKHYSSANGNNGKTCKSGKAKITQYVKRAKHPYHLIAVSGEGSTIYGWADANDISPLAQSGYNSWVGKVYNCSVLNVRTGAGTKYGKLQAWPQLRKGNLVDVLGEVKADNGGKWYYVNIQGNKGYVYSDYITKV